MKGLLPIDVMVKRLEALDDKTKIRVLGNLLAATMIDIDYHRIVKGTRLEETFGRNAAVMRALRTNLETDWGRDPALPSTMQKLFFPVPVES